MFSLINVGERSGSGLCDIYSTWEENGFAKPVIQELSDPARVVLTLETVSVSDEARNEARTQELSEREIQMLDIIASKHAGCIGGDAQRTTEDIKIYGR